ncbi:MAG TPA: UpxY family transcription antiterminator [Bryobacteraceae bacterium]|jgi:transcription antitermination factor NusG|nr:UpxY family transcription antiterminator [Bryobacteraceae bacterium]
MSTSPRSWYAVHVKTNFEKVASTILQGKNLEVYLPAYKKRRRWSDRIKDVECPLFPGYVFCRFDVNDRLPVLSTTGVLSVVGSGRTPASISDEELQAVRMIVESGLAAMPWPFLRVGQRVVIRKGPLSGMEGILLEQRNKYRIVVSISLLQRSIAAEIDADLVCATPSRFSREAANAAVVI